MATACMYYSQNTYKKLTGGLEQFRQYGLHSPAAISSRDYLYKIDGGLIQLSVVSPAVRLLVHTPRPGLSHDL